MGNPPAEEAEETRTAFFYGTLMAPQVFFAVCYHSSDPAPDIKARHAFAPAVLHDYCRHRVKNADYPGMIEDPGRSVFGMVVGGITKANLQLLDFFEGSAYDRRVVRPRLLTTVGDDKGAGNVEGEQVVTESYIFLNKDELEFREWDFAEFKRDKLTKWTRAGYVFEDCDPDDKATTSSAV